MVSPIHIHADRLSFCYPQEEFYVKDHNLKDLNLKFCVQKQLYKIMVSCFHLYQTHPNAGENTKMENEKMYSWMWKQDKHFEEKKHMQQTGPKPRLFGALGLYVSEYSQNQIISVGKEGKSCFIFVQSFWLKPQLRVRWGCLKNARRLNMNNVLVTIWDGASV